MHRVVLSLLVVFLIVMEELFRQKPGRAGRLPIRPAETGMPGKDFDRFDLLRLLELLFLGLLFSTSAGNAATGHGQITIVLAGLQTARLFGRRVLSRWSVLWVIQAFELLLLVSILFLPLHLIPEAYLLSPKSLLALVGGMIFSILVYITAAFSLSYGVRLFAREHSHLYNVFPPLAGSEEWAYKFSVFALPSGIVGAVSLFFLRGVSLLPVIFSLSVLLQSLGVVICRKKTFNGHHPVVHILWSISFLVLYFITITGLTTVGPLQ
jgi:hypothetical protein